MHHRRPPASRGPSSKTWPRWEPQRAQRASVRIIPCERSSTSSTASGETVSVKLGHPVPEWYFALLSKRGLAQAAQWYSPFSSLSTYSPENGGSVAASRRTAYCSVESRFRHSSSVRDIPSLSALTSSPTGQLTPVPPKPQYPLGTLCRYCWW